MVRDKKLNLESDIDIGVIGSINTLYKQKKNDNCVKSFIKSDTTGDILNFTFKDEVGPVIDVYRWSKFKGMYWHTYDYLMEQPKEGIPSKYHFKSMPVEVFDISDAKKKGFREDINYYSNGQICMGKLGTWVKSLPEAPAEGIDFQMPFMYGYFLDIAYPDWATPRPQSGQSKGYTEFDTKSCKGLC